MKYLLILLISLSTFSCITAKKKAKICRECAGKDSVSYVERVTIIPKDTTIYISIPGPSVYLDNPCKNLCDSLGNLKPFRITEKKNGLKTTIKSVGNSIVAECEADSLKRVITLLNKEIERSSFQKKVVQEDCTKRHQNIVDIICRWGFLISIIIIIILNRKFIFNLIKKII